MKISGKAFVTKALKPSLASKYQKSYIPQSIKNIARKAGVNLDHPETSLTSQKARGLMRLMDKEGVLKSGAGWSGFDDVLAKAAKPEGPSKAVLEGRKKLDMRDRLKEDAERDKRVKEALSHRAPENDNARGAPKPSAARLPTPAGGTVIADAARGATRPSGPETGGFSGAGRHSANSIEGAEAPAKPEPPPKEAKDIFGYDEG